MPLSKSNGSMYPWVDFMHTHLGGECPHACSYCYVKAMAKRFGHDRYQGAIRLIEKEFRVNYVVPGTYFIEHCNDLWAAAVPDAAIVKVLEHCREWPENEYVFQTKNPGRYMDFLGMMPEKRILGCTIETTNAEIAASVSKAPSPRDRFECMDTVAVEGERVFITIEPILRGCPGKLAAMISELCPEFVNIGADSKGTGLDEPTREEVRELIDKLGEYHVEIREKHNLDRLLK